jgi:predicted membrane-bound dolichyl-phosphate-mannose-protein mannosyltransferase
VFLTYPEHICHESWPSTHTSEKIHDTCFVREQYKSYSGISPNSLNYWVEMIFDMLDIDMKTLKGIVWLLLRDVKDKNNEDVIG